MVSKPTHHRHEADGVKLGTVQLAMVLVATQARRTVNGATQYELRYILRDGQENVDTLPAEQYATFTDYFNRDSCGGFRVFSETLAMRLRGAYLTFHRLANSQIEPSGITADQFVVMTILADEPGLTQREVVERAYSDQNTIGAILKRLEDKQLIVRKAHPSDGRAWSVFLTENGRKRQQLVTDNSRVMHEKLSGLFSHKEQQTLQRLLARIPPAMVEKRQATPEEAA